MPVDIQLNLQLIQSIRNRRRRRRHLVLGTIIAVFMLSVGITLLVLGFKYNIEDVWLLGAIFLGLVVLLFTVSGIAIAIPTYAAHRHKKREEKERIKRDFQFPHVHYELVETSPQTAKKQTRTIHVENNEAAKENQNVRENGNNDENGHGSNQEESCTENVEIKIRTSSSSSSILEERI